MPRKIGAIGKRYEFKLNQAALTPVREVAYQFPLNSDKFKDKIIFTIKIHEKSYDFLFDTGATISLMKATFLAEIGLSPSKTTPILLRLANGQLIETNNFIEIDLTFNEKNLKQKFYILNELHENALLGMDFFNSASLYITTDQDLQINYNTGPDVPETFDYVPISIMFLDFKIQKNIKEDFYCVPSKEARQMIAIYINESVKKTKDENFGINLYNVTKEESFETFDFKIECKEKSIIPEIKALLNEFKHLFAFNITDLKGANGVAHVIDTGESPPIKQRNYRYGHYEQQEIRRQVREMLEAGVIRPAFSPWSNPIVLVKRDDKYRLCLDYRKLNAVTKVDVFPLPIIEDLVDRLAGNPIMSIFDLKSGFWQIPIAERDREKTAFTADNNTYEFLYMPFGLVNAPSTFQRLMNTVFEDILNRNVSVYIDDIIVYSRTIEEHMNHLRQVFERLDSRDLRLHPQKCRFLCDEIKFLGFVINKSGIKPDPTRTEAIRKFPVPQKVKDIRSFIGMANFYRKYIKDFAIIAKPLTMLIRKEVKFNFNEECHRSFNKIKEFLTNEPILAHYRIDDQLILYTDASGYGLGAILTQIQDEKERTLQYASATLTKHQENYSVTEKEMLAIVWSVEKFRSYLYGQKFIIRVDHCSLCYLLKMKDPYGKLARWSLRLQPYEYDIQYKSGKSHGNVDFSFEISTGGENS